MMDPFHDPDAQVHFPHGQDCRCGCGPIYTTRRNHDATDLARTARRAINKVAWQMLRAGRITAEQYQRRIDRANATTDAPYHMTMARRVI